MKTRLILLALLVLICVSGSCSAVIYSTPSKSINLGHGATDNDLLEFLVVQNSGYYVSIVDAYSGDEIKTLYAASGAPGSQVAHANIQQAFYTSNNRLFYIVTIGSTTYLVEKLAAEGMPMWYNGEPVIVDSSGYPIPPVSPTTFKSPATDHRVITSGVAVSPIREEGGYIYFLKGGDVYRMPVTSIYSSLYYDLTTGGAFDFDIYDGSIYSVHGYTSGYPTKVYCALLKDNVAIKATYKSSSGGTLAYRGSIQVLNASRIYVDASATRGDTAYLRSIYNETGAVVSALPTSSALNANGMWCISNADTIAGICLGTGGLEFLDIGEQKRSPSGSSSSSGSTSDTGINPLIDLDGDGQFTQDDAKDMALTLGPATWIFMFMIFLMVAMSMSGGGRRR